MATDMKRVSLAERRKERWVKAFRNKTESMDNESVNLKITCVLELLMQAASVSHALQEWKLYLKWSKRQFHQKRLRSDWNTRNWYKDELNFLDNFVLLCRTVSRMSIVWRDFS